ncbi:MAG: endonuclease III [Gammaproteobacteria bacterium]|jgi:endonuclease-3|nr:endonuclease III [Gammaproteobacteria bacterium]
MNQAQRDEMFRRWQLQNPKPQTELQYQSAFELLVAVALSAQSTDVGVNKVTSKLFPIANTPEAILALGEPGLKKHLQSLGLYNNKTKNLLACCQMLLDRFHGEVPNTRAELEQLPGVGRKTANVVLNCAFNEPTMAVDTHIFRVANRTGLARGKTPLAVEKLLLKRISPIFQQHAHHWLILHGRYTCKSRSPRCSECIINDLCEFSHKSDHAKQR